MFIIKSDLLRCIWEKSDFAAATPICAAGVVWLLLKEGVVCDVLHRWEQDDHAHYDQKDLRVIFHRTGSISSDKSGSICLVFTVLSCNIYCNCLRSSDVIAFCFIKLYISLLWCSSLQQSSLLMLSALICHWFWWQYDGFSFVDFGYFLVLSLAIL